MRPLLDRPSIRKQVPPIIVGLAMLAAWEFGTKALQIPSYLLPAPSVIYKSFMMNWTELLYASLMTARVTLLSFGLSIVIGAVVAVAFVQSPMIERSFFPYVVLLQVTPIVAIAPLLIILLDDAQTAMIICATVVAFFPMVSNTTIGLKSVDPGLLNYFRLNRASRIETLIRLRLPSALPYFMAGLRISSGLALIGAVVSEFVAGTGGRSAGLAFEIMQSGFQVNIPKMFAALILIALFGILLFTAMVALSNRVLGHWHESAVS